MWQLFSNCVTLTCVLPFTLIFCAFIALNSSYFDCIRSILSQCRCSLEPKSFLRGLKLCSEGLRLPTDSPAPLMLSALAFLLIKITLGIMSFFSQIFFPAGFSDIHPEHNKMA